MNEHNTIWCDGCGAEILWVPYRDHERNYCCQDCAEGVVCDCGDALDWDDEYREAASAVNIPI